MQTCATTFNLVVSCDSLGLFVCFNSSCYGHALLKVCQYATLDDKVAKALCYG